MRFLPQSARARRLAPLVVIGLVALGVGGVTRARAERPPPPDSMLHEQIPEDPREDVGYAATTLEGDLPAAVQTPSGLTTAPDPRKSPSEDHVYGGTTTDDTPESTYEPDRDTRRPHIENYDDPFSPATAPFKRLRAYDWVEADYSLHVRDKSVQKMAVGGTANAGDEPFYGDLSVDLIPGQLVRIPTVGPGARVLRMHANPEVPVDLVHDGADNWFARGTTRTRVRLVVELAIARDTFGREFADVDWTVLDAVAVGSQAGGGAMHTTSGASGARLHDAAFNEVAKAIGISRSMRPREVVHKMVDYFRSFAPSEEPPTGHGDIYLDLALSKKGVCRHRAFAFLVTAIGIGLPARMVVNEAHAWVEIYDSKLWHRVDLGGAAANLQNEPDPNKPAYVPPPDPYQWPTARDSGQDLADRNRAQNQEKAGGADSAAGDAGAPTGPPGSATPSTTNRTDPVDTADPKLPESEVTVGAIDGDVHRGLPLHLQGVVTSAGAPCAHLRVDVMVIGHAGGRASRGSRDPREPSPGIPVGSLSTDEKGRYDGAVVVPRDLPLGDYELVVHTAGDARCGAGHTR